MPHNLHQSLSQHPILGEIVVDMHTHSTASDGKCSPKEIVELALKRGLCAIAISDHDTLDGIDEAIEASNGKDIEIIPSIELSTIDENRSIHILGYHVNHRNPVFTDLLVKIIEERVERAVKIICKLNKIGVNLTIADIRGCAGKKFIGRVHIAQAMVEKGYISEIKDAFSKKYIGRGGVAYVERYRLSVPDAISIIHQAGGWAVIAHPGGNEDDIPLNEIDFRKFLQWGLDGIEVFTFKHSPQQSAHYEKLAEKLGLMITGGSDFHGKGHLNVGDFGLSKNHYTQFRNRVRNEKR